MLGWAKKLGGWRSRGGGANNTAASGQKTPPTQAAQPAQVNSQRKIDGGNRSMRRGFGVR